MSAVNIHCAIKRLPHAELPTKPGGTGSFDSKLATNDWDNIW